jgi:ABC-type transport system involved in cytochrome bd biosynthesis fused ATPase/permease subunit
MFLRGSSAMLPLLVMFRGNETYIRFILFLALVSLAVADEIFEGLYDANAGWHDERDGESEKREIGRLGEGERRR